MADKTEVTVRAAGTAERIVQNNDGTFTRSIMPQRVTPPKEAPVIGESKVTVDVGGDSLLDAAKARVARQLATRTQRSSGDGKPAPAAKAAPAAPVAAKVETPTPAAAPPAESAPAKEAAALAALAGEKPATPPAEAAPATPAPAAATPVAEDTPKPEQIAEWKATLARQAHLLEQASSEIERLSKGQADEVKARLEKLHAAEDAYLDNPVAATRKYLAAALGVTDDHADIDAEIDALIRDLIAARHPGTVQIDEGQRANRESALIKRSLIRDRQRAEAKRSETDVQEQRRQAELADQSDRQIIARHLESNKQQHPHLMALAGPFDGSTPEAKVLEAIKAGIAVGHFDPKTPPERLLVMGAELAEKHYRARLESIQRARPNPDTAAPSPPPVQPAEAADANVRDGGARQSHGSRTITNADASVAPAGAVEMATKPETRPKTTAEHLRAVMQKHGIKTRG